MNLLKSSILALISASFVLSCGQSASTPNSQNAVANQSTSTTSVAVDSGNTSIAARRRDRAVEAVVSDDDKVTDLYTEKCMICHKDTGKGGKMTLEGKTITPIDLTSAKIKARSDEKLLSQIKEGDPDEGMPAFKGKLSDEEIKTIIQRIRKF